MKYQKIFDAIYEFAKNQNESGLRKFLKKNNVAVNIYIGELMPITKLARENNKAAVDFLINRFHGNRNGALYGYAWGGHVREVDALLEAGCFDHDALEGYARGGHSDQVKNLIAAGTRIKYALWGYARSNNVMQTNLLLKAGASRSHALHAYTSGNHIEAAEKLLSAGADRDSAANGYAQYGNVQKVDELIASGADRDDALWGYAKGGHFKKVNQEILNGGSRDTAVEAFAINGYIHEVNKLIAAGASKERALIGYARGGQIDQVNEMLAAGGSRDDVVLCYAEEGFHDLVNAQIALGANRECAVEGYLTYLKDSEETVLRLAAYTDDVQLRKLLIVKARDWHTKLNIDAMFEKATRIYDIMHDYGFTFTQAKSLLMTGTREWLLQGPALVRDGTIPLEIYHTITHCLTNLTSQNIETVRTTVTEKLFSDTVDSLSSQFKACFFAQSKDPKNATAKHSAEECLKEQIEAGQVFLKRMKY